MDEQFLSAGGNPAGPSLGWWGGNPQAPEHMTRMFALHDFTLVSLSTQELAAPHGFSLILIDCAGLSPAAVQDYLTFLHITHGELRQALLWVEPDSPYEQLVHWSGVKGIFPAQCNEAQLLNGVRSIMAGQNWLPRRLLEQCLEKQRGRQPKIKSLVPQSLTEREREILQHVGEAATNARIASDLCISEHTVKTHLYNIFRKIQVRNRTEASNWVRVNLQESIL